MNYELRIMNYVLRIKNYDYYFLLAGRDSRVQNYAL